MSADALLEIENLVTRYAARRRRGSGGRRRESSRYGAARRSASWANRAAVSALARSIPAS